MTEQVNNEVKNTELTETQQQLLGEFVNATVRKVLPVTIIGEKATCVFRHVFGFVDNYQYGVDETGNVVVQDMASGNYGMIEGNVLCSLLSVYEKEIAACKKDEVKQIEPDLLKEAGLAGLV